MKIIKVSTSNPEQANLFLRQTSGKLGVWGDCQFFINQPIERCDWWFICHYSSVLMPETTICDPDHIVFISMEPKDSWIPSSFFNQFSQLIICDRSISHSNIKYGNGLTWWVGIEVRHDNGHHFSPEIKLTYDTLKEIPIPEKQNRISVICSRKNLFPGHVKRLAFLDKLLAHPVSKYIDFFGGGFRPIPDKWDAIAPYKYHLVLENSIVPDYWSEKLGDAFLGYAYPVYYGCPNFNRFFNDKSLETIDIDKFDQTVLILESLLLDDQHNNHLPYIIEARNKVLNDYNIFQLMSDICIEPAKKFKNCKLKPVNYFERSWSHRLAHKTIFRFRGR